MNIEIEAGESKEIVEPDTKLPGLTPAERKALAEATVKWKAGTPKARRDHNRTTLITALQCIEHGLPIVDVHSIEDGGPCTCQWAVEKNKREGRPAPAPCEEHNWGKHPRGLGWQKGKTVDREAVKARWGAAMGYLNVGIVYGGDVNVALVDEDGPAGAATTAAWRSDPAKGMPDTVTVISGSGGYHYYFRIPEGWDLRNSSKKIGGGIDLRGTNGFSVAPGSRHRKGVATNWADGVGIYRWMEGRSPDDIAIADAPVWMLRKMWFATKSRRHEIAPDGSTWEDADLGDWETDDEKKTKPSNTPTVSPANPSDPLHDAAAAALASEGGSSAIGWEAKVQEIGHGPGLGGFDNAVYVAACSYFGTFGYEADDTPLRSALLDRIGIAPEDDPGHRDRYLTDDYLDGRIQQARGFVESKGGEAIKVKGQSHGWPFGFQPEGDRLCYRRKNEETKAWEPVEMCTLFEVIGRTLDETRRSAYGTLIAYQDEHGVAREVTILDSDICSDTGGLLAELRNAGFWIQNTTEAKAKFLTCMGRLKSDKVVIVANRPGWHDGTFVDMHGQAYGANPGMRLAEGMRSVGMSKMGTMEGWQDTAADLMFHLDTHGPILLCSAFAGPLIDLLKRDPAGIAATGSSSVGKTNAQRAAATVWGDPTVGKGTFIEVRGTDNGLETHATRLTCMGLQINELKGAKAPIGDILMMLSGGTTANRQDGKQGLQKQTRFHGFFTMSAEDSMRDLIEGRNSNFVTGHAVRAVEIDVTGAIELEDKRPIVSIEDRMKRHWGHAGPAFIAYLLKAGYVADPGKLVERLDDAATWLLDGKPGSGAKGRAAGVLAYALVGGEIAQDGGIMPWEGDDCGWARNDGFLRSAFRAAWDRSWGSDTDTPENSPEAAWRRLEGRIASEWHLHSRDENAFAEAAEAESPRYGDGEPRLAKWFYTGSAEYVMRCEKEGEAAAYCSYDAINQDAFRYLIKGCGVKETALLKYAKDKGMLLPQGKNSVWHKLPGYRSLSHYRFKVGTFGPGDAE